MSRHSMMTTFRYGAGASEDHEVEVEIVYDFTPGYPATGPTYDSGGEPGCGPETDIISIHQAALVNGVVTWEPLDRRFVAVLASDDELHCQLAAYVEDDGPDPDLARERLAEMRAEDLAWHMGKDAAE